MQINFKIIDDRLALVGQYQRLVSGNTNTYVCKFENNNSDESLTWYAVFYASDGCAYRQEIQNGECYIPGAAIKAEHQFSLKIGVYGTVIAEDEVRRISTNLVLLNIVAGGYCEEAVSDVPSHDIWEEMVLKTIPLIGENGNWYIYDPEKKDYIDSGKPARGPEYVLTDEDKLSIAKTTAPILQPNIDAAAGQAKQYADSKDNELRADIEAELDAKANSADVYTKTETDGKLDTKVDKESGKGLSANDYTNTDKAKVNNLPDDTGAELDTKANSADVYTKTETDGKLDAKANSADLANYVKNTDIATASELGIVKFNASFGISVNANGQPFINKAPQSVIDNRAENPSASYYPIVPSNFDYAASKSTHQDMSDNYDVSTLQVSESFEGNQGQLPVSYDASKGYIDEKFSDSTPITTASGYPLTVTDHLEGESVINYQVYGNSTQATRSGKNILPYPYKDTTKTMSGITFTDNGDGTITVNGTSTGDAIFTLCTTNILDKSKKYFLSGNPNSSIIMQVVVFDTNNNSHSWGDNGNGVAIDLLNSGDWEISKTTIFIHVSSGTTLSNVVIKPQIEEGTTATEYEQYGVMPSPDYPSEIMSVGDLVTDETSEYYGKYDIPVAVRGKNLFDKRKSISTSIQEETPAIYWGTQIFDNKNILSMLKLNTTYTISYDVKCVEMPTGDNITINSAIAGIAFYSGKSGYSAYFTYKSIKLEAGNTYHIEQTFTTDDKLYDSNANYRFMAAGNKYYDENNKAYYCTVIIRNIQIEEGNAATSYEPYIGETKHIYLNEPLRKVGDYADYIDYKNQRVVHNLGEQELLSSDNYYAYEGAAINFYGFYVNVKDMEKGRRQYGCHTHLKNIPNDTNSCVWFGVGNNNVYMSFPDIYNSAETDTGRIAAFKAYLISQSEAGTPVKIVYPLAEPTEEPITVPELTAPNSAVMNVSSGTVISPSSMDVVYYQDINKKLDEIHEDISNTQSELSTKANSSDLVNYVKFTDYATPSKAGVVKYNVAFGIGVNSEGYVYAVAANKNEIDLRTTSRKPIVPSNLDYAVRSVYPITQTALSDPITVNTIYDLGLQTDIAIALPSGQLGDFIEFDFISGTTATTLSVSSSNGIIGYDLIPEANNIYTLYFDWGVIACDTTGVQTYGWRCNYFEYAITLSEPSST